MFVGGEIARSRDIYTLCRHVGESVHKLVYGFVGMSLALAECVRGLHVFVGSHIEGVGACARTRAFSTRSGESISVVSL